MVSTVDMQNFVISGILFFLQIFCRIFHFCFWNCLQFFLQFFPNVTVNTVEFSKSLTLTLLKNCRIFCNVRKNCRKKCRFWKPGKIWPAGITLEYLIFARFDESWEKFWLARSLSHQNPSARSWCHRTLSYLVLMILLNNVNNVKT